MSTLHVLVGLASGLLLGVIASVTGWAPLLALVDAVEPLGTLFVRGIQMTVIPLVVASLVVGVASTSDVSTVARLGGRAVVVFTTLIVLAATFAAAIAAPILARLDLDSEVVAALRESAGADASTLAAATSLPGIAQWLVELVPANPVAAASSGAMLPLIVFTLGFGAALTRVSEESRSAVVGGFRGLAEAMMTLVQWVLRLAPVGVFALAAPLAARMGVAAAGALLSYIALAAILTSAFLVFLLYPITAAAGRVSLRSFARAVAPAQVVAFSSRSTMATLPAMIDSARGLGLSEGAVSFLVPLSASVFRVGSAVGQTVGVLFAAQLYGATPGPAQLATIIVTVAVTTFTVPGIPGGSIIVMVPILLAANLPVEGIALLLGADTIPDMFRTTANVTGGISAATILDRTVEEGSMVGGPIPEAPPTPDDPARPDSSG